MIRAQLSASVGRILNVGTVLALGASNSFKVFQKMKGSRSLAPTNEFQTEEQYGVRLHFHLQRHLANGSTKINRNSWYRVRYEALDAAKRANSEGDFYWDALACTSDRCERRKNTRSPGDGIRELN